MILFKKQITIISSYFLKLKFSFDTSEKPSCVVLILSCNSFNTTAMPFRAIFFFFCINK